MPKSKDFYQRIEIIDECFRHKGKKWTIDGLMESVNQKLIERFESPISKRTLQYALDYLIQEKEAPIEKSKEGTRVLYFYSDVSFSIKNLPLNDEEIVLLKDAVGLIKQIGNTSIAKDLVTLVQKLENTIAENPTLDRTILQFEQHAIVNGLEYLDDLLISIKGKIVLNILYQPFGKEAYEQTIHPYLLKEFRNRWFLIGMQAEGNRICNLALDRIKNIKPTSLPFTENDFFNPDTYFSNLIGVTFPVDEHCETIVLKVTPNQAPYIKTKPIHFNQEVFDCEDGCLIVKLNLFNNYELRSILLSYGSDVEVLQPEILRRQMKDIFEEATAKYEIDQKHQSSYYN